MVSASPSLVLSANTLTATVYNGQCNLSLYCVVIDDGIPMELFMYLSKFIIFLRWLM
jgi:hypothetical protein